MRVYINYTIIILLIQTSVLGQSNTDKDFIATKGKWKSPIDKITKIDTMGPCYYPCDLPRGLTIQTDSNRLIHAVQSGQVVMVTYIGENYAIIVRNSNYLIAYSCFKATSKKKGDYVKLDDELGVLAGNDETGYELELSLLKGTKEDKRMQDWFTDDFRKKARVAK